MLIQSKCFSTVVAATTIKRQAGVTPPRTLACLRVPFATQFARPLSESLTKLCASKQTESDAKSQRIELASLFGLAWLLRFER